MRFIWVSYAFYLHMNLIECSLGKFICSMHLKCIGKVSVRYCNSQCIVYAYNMHKVYTLSSVHCRQRISVQVPTVGRQVLEDVSQSIFWKRSCSHHSSSFALVAECFCSENEQQHFIGTTRPHHF